MKSIKFSTITERTIEIAFCEQVFLDWMGLHGKPNLSVEDQIGFYIEFMFRLARNEHIISIDYLVSKTFVKKYELIDAILKYDI